MFNNSTSGERTGAIGFLTYPKVGVALAAAVALVLPGCARGEQTSDSPSGDRGTIITTVITKSGFTCAVMDSTGKDLSCNFDSKSAPTGQDPTGDKGTQITEVITRSGFFCVVMDGDVGKDIECDWSGPRYDAQDSNPKGDGGTTITEVKLATGQKCAVMDGPKAKALDCDWATPD